MSVRTARLEDVCEINPRAPKNINDETPVSFLPMSAVSEDGYVAFEEARTYGEVKKGYTYFERGDVLVAKITPCFENGKAASTQTIQNVLGFGSTEFHVLRPSPALDPKYAFYLLWSERFRSIGEKGMTGSAGQKRVPADLLRRLEIPLPPLDEQKRIAAILDKADQLRQKRRQAIALLDSLTQSIFLETFGDIRENPKGFPKASLGELCTFKGGAQPPKSTFSYDDGPDKIRLIQIRDYKSDRFKTFIPRNLAKRFCDETDIMIGRYGPPVFQILRGIAGSYNVALMKAEPKKGIEKAFLFYLLSASKLQSDVIAQSQRTAGQTGVNLDYLNDYQVFRPSLEVQGQFHARVKIAEHKLLEASRFLDNIESLFSSLQHRAFSGQL